MNTKPFQNLQLSTLGMGNMRLPQKGHAANSPIDWEASAQIIDYALEHGVNYFDTAWVYNEGESERCLGAALKRHEADRDKFYIADKFNIDATTDYRMVFEEQLRRLQTDYIDFYLIHCLMDTNLQRYIESGAIEYFLEQKRLGRIRYLGFSSHASVDTLRTFADHHAWDFAQLQINYYDWHYCDTEQEYRILEERHIPCIVMEPVRGGKLAQLPPEAEQMLRAVHPDWSMASWAMRFVQTLPNVQVVLSGMSNMEQIEDNVRTFSTVDTGLTEADKAVLWKACELFRAYIHIPCTGCRYCTADCPQQINIPEFISIYNRFRVNGTWGIKDAMQGVTTEGRPSDCIQCGACMGHCPQSIQIPDLMTKIVEMEQTL